MVQFSCMRDLARRELSEYLNKYVGTKVLVWDEGLTGPMDLIAKFKFFQERHVIKMFPLKDGRLPKVSTENIVFVTRPIPAQMDKIADNVKGKDREALRTLVESLIQMTTFISRIFLKLVELQFKVPIIS